MGQRKNRVKFEAHVSAADAKFLRRLAAEANRSASHLVTAIIEAALPVLEISERAERYRLMPRASRAARVPAVEVKAFGRTSQSVVAVLETPFDRKAREEAMRRKRREQAKAKREERKRINAAWRRLGLGGVPTTRR